MQHRQVEWTQLPGRRWLAKIWQPGEREQVERDRRVAQYASPKHLGQYVDEFSFRLNEGNVKLHTLIRLNSFVAGTAGKRLTYKALIA